MKDNAVIRCISIAGGVALLAACLVTGMDGETKVMAGALIGFGIGIPIGAAAERLDLKSEVTELKQMRKLKPL